MRCCLHLYHSSSSSRTVLKAAGLEFRRCSFPRRLGGGPLFYRRRLLYCRLFALHSQPSFKHAFQQLLLGLGHHAVEILRPAAEAKSITIETKFGPGVKPIWGDSARLQQVLSNVLSNAIKFTPRSGRVEVACESAGSNVVIVVKDNGIGIKPDFLPHVFERFRQADATSARSFGGLGLGLSIVRNLLELHGGSISAESERQDRGAPRTSARGCARPPGCGAAPCPDALPGRSRAPKASPGAARRA